MYSMATWTDGLMLWCCRKYPGTTIVTDSVTSNGLSDFIKAQGGKHYRSVL